MYSTWQKRQKKKKKKNSKENIMENNEVFFNLHIFHDNKTNYMFDKF